MTGYWDANRTLLPRKGSETGETITKIMAILKFAQLIFLCATLPPDNPLPRLWLVLTLK